MICLPALPNLCSLPCLTLICSPNLPIFPINLHFSSFHLCLFTFTLHKGVHPISVSKPALYGIREQEWVKFSEVKDPGSSSRKQEGPLIYSSSPVEDQNPGWENVKVKDFRVLQQQVADWMTEIKIVGEYKNLRMRRERERRMRGKAKCALTRLISSLQIHFQIGDQRERERERERDPGRDGALGSSSYLLPSVEFESQRMAL